MREAQDECIKSILMCMQGFYKEAMMSLRQAMEHMLFAIFLSTVIIIIGYGNEEHMICLGIRLLILKRDFWKRIY